MEEKEKMHSIKANLYPNALTGGPNDYAAKVISERTLTLRDVCISAINRGGAPTKVDTMELNVNQFLKEMVYQLIDGYSVNAGYFMVRAMIKGVFNSPQETFNKKKHSIYFLFNQGEPLRKIMDEVKVEIMGLGNSNPVIDYIMDMKTKSINDKLTPERNLRVTGDRIKIAGDDPEVGIFFVSEADGTIYRVDEEDIVINNPSEIMVVVPNLPEGAYKLKIVTQFTSASTLKHPRTVQSDVLLTVSM